MKINIFSLKYWLLYSVVVGISALHSQRSEAIHPKFLKISKKGRLARKAFPLFCYELVYVFYFSSNLEHETANKII